MALVLLLAAAGGCSTSAVTSSPPPLPTQDEAPPPESSDEDKLIDQGVQLVLQHRPAEAIHDAFDKVIAKYEAQYGHGGQIVYCSRFMDETVAYMLLARSNGEDAVAIGPAWSDAYYFKGSALVEFGRLAEARTALEKAVALSPRNSAYLSELAFTYQVEKNWEKALELFATAAAAQDYSPPSEKILELTRALRGEGYSLTELGRFDEAEAKYRESLAADPGDHKSEQELRYIAELRSKSTER